MVEKNLKRPIVHWAQNTEAVRQVVMTGDRVNRAAVKIEFLPYEWLLSLGRGAVWQEPDWAQVFGEMPLHLAHPDHTGRTVHLLFADRSRVILRFLEQEALDSILREDSLCEVILDKDARYGARPRPTDLSRRVKKPTEEQFRAWCDAYFVEIVDAAFAAADQQPLPAATALERARGVLLQMTEAAIAAGSDFSINLGIDGSNLRAYAETVWYDHYVRTYAAATVDSIWDAVFQACMLFRKAGLLLGEKCGYAYPKKEDVEILQMLRTTWEEKTR